MFDSVANTDRISGEGGLAMQQTRPRPTILIVEDYADSRHMLKLLLEELDYRVLTAASGTEALAIAAGNHIDLVLLDFGLPDMTGPVVVRRLRRLNNELTRVPIIMVTAFEGYQYRQLADEAGCDAFLAKPPDFDMLNETLDRLLQESETTGSSDVSKYGVGSGFNSIPSQVVRK